MKQMIFWALWPVEVRRKGMDVTILSGDRDLLQLATDKIMIRLPKTSRGKTTIENFHAEQVLEKYQVTPPQIIELKALMGDSADNIPGIPGVGEKTATKLIVQYGSIENAHEHLEEVKPNKAKESLREHYDLAVLSKTWQRSTRTARWNLPTRRQGFRIFIRRKLTNFANVWNSRTF